MAETSDFEFHIYNSMTKQKEKFKPLVPGKVSMYVCGVTSYDYSHIGHARAYVAFDVLYRLIQFPSKSAYDAALRAVTRKGCLYKLERVSVL